MNSVRKFTERRSIQITSLLGLFIPQVSDEDFKREEAKFRLVEKCLRQFYADINIYLMNIKVTLRYQHF